MPVHPDAVSQTWVEEAKRESGIYIVNILQYNAGTTK